MLLAVAVADATGAWCGTTSSDPAGSVTATATDSVGNTSEFAANRPVVGDAAVCGTGTVDRIVTSDSFNRSVTQGWGSDDRGNPWVLSGGAYRFGVNGAEATMLQDSAFQSVHAVLNGPSLVDVDETVRIRTDKLASGAGAYFYAGHRFQDHSNYYRLEVGFGTTQSVSLKWAKFAGAVATDIVPATTVARARHEANAWYRVRLQVRGTNPTTFRAKLWPDGALEPSGWDISGTDGEPVLQQPGAVSLRTLIGASFSGFPIVASWDDLVVRRP
jgi:hypothetical protein